MRYIAVLNQGCPGATFETLVLRSSSTHSLTASRIRGRAIAVPMSVPSVHHIEGKRVE